MILTLPQHCLQLQTIICNAYPLSLSLTESPFLIGSQHAGSKLLLIFSSTVPSPKELGLKVTFDISDNVCNNYDWSNPWNNKCAKLWELTLPVDCSHVLLCDNMGLLKQFDSSELKIKSGEVVKKFPEYFDAETKVNSFIYFLWGTKK